MPSPKYVFNKLTNADLPMMRRWLAEPHMNGWWGDPAHEIELLKVDLSDTRIDQRVVLYGTVPFGYVQDYDVHYEYMPQFELFPKGSRAMDMMIGDPAMLGHGHAAAFMRLRALQLCSNGAPSVVIDPEPTNKRAVRAYRAAGFIDVEICPCEDGSPVLVMEFKKD